MLILRSGLRFLFWALEVPQPRVRKMSFSLTKMTFSSLYRQTDRQYDDRGRILDSEFALSIIISLNVQIEILPRILVFTFSSIYKINCEFFLFVVTKLEWKLPFWRVLN